MLKAVQASAACEVFPMIWKALRQLQVKRKQLDKLNKKLDKFQPQEFRKDLVYSWQIRPSYHISYATDHKAQTIYVTYLCI